MAALSRVARCCVAAPYDPWTIQAVICPGPLAHIGIIGTPQLRRPTRAAPSRPTGGAAQSAAASRATGQHSGAEVERRNLAEGDVKPVFEQLYILDA